MKKQLEKVLEGNDLSFSEAYETMFSIMSGEENNSQIAALLTSLKIKGESYEEIAGFAKAMRDKAVKIKCDDENIIDVCGTGGDGSGTFNISTAASFVLAGAGVKVAKHGNRSITSKSGSSDVLEELGVNVKLPPELSERSLNEIGIAFLFAPLYHPAMKYVAPIRRELEFRTAFNILGPLTNPAGTKRQVIGTFNDRASELMSEASKLLDMTKVTFICTNDSFDEITLTHPTKVKEVGSDSPLLKYELTHETFSSPQIELHQIQGGSAKENAEIICDIFEGKEKGAPYNVVVANAALGFKTAGVSESIEECIAIAKESIESGKALKKLKELKEFGDKN